MGRDRLTVKPSANPTLVRTQHLPLPAETARQLGIPGLASCYFLAFDFPLCPWEPGCAQTYSGQRPRSWARPGGTFGRELLDAGKQKRAVHRAAGSWIPMPAALCEQLVRLRKITGGSTVWPTHGLRDPQGTHENRADIGVSRWSDYPTRQPAPAWSTDELQNATTGHG